MEYLISIQDLPVQQIVSVRRTLRPSEIPAWHRRGRADRLSGDRRAFRDHMRRPMLNTVVPCHY